MAGSIEPVLMRAIQFVRDSNSDPEIISSISISVYSSLCDLIISIITQTPENLPAFVCDVVLMTTPVN